MRITKMPEGYDPSKNIHYQKPLPKSFIKPDTALYQLLYIRFHLNSDMLLPHFVERIIYIHSGLRIIEAIKAGYVWYLKPYDDGQLQLEIDTIQHLEEKIERLCYYQNDWIVIDERPQP